VELPLKFTNNKIKIEEIQEKFLNKLLLERNAYSPPFDHNEAWWTRFSAQIWNEVCHGFFFLLVLVSSCSLADAHDNDNSLTILIRSVKYGLRYATR
jgi:hypothetical protein